MGHCPWTLCSRELCSARGAPSASILYVRMPILQAALAPLTGIARWQEGHVVGICTLSDLSGVLPIVFCPTLPARWTSGPIGFCGPGVATFAGHPAGGGGLNGVGIDGVSNWVSQLLDHPPVKVLVNTLLVGIEGVWCGNSNCQHRFVNGA